MLPSRSDGQTFGKSNFDAAISVDVDQIGNVYTTGHFTGTVDFNPSSNSNYNLSSNSSSADIYVQKLDSMGNFVWAKSFGAAWDDTPYDIHLDKEGNLYTIGRFGLTIDFDPGPNTFYLTGNGDMDVYLLKLDTAGQFIWAKSWGASSADYGISVTTDDEGNVTRLNPVAEQLTGWTNEDAQKRPLKDIFSIVNASTREAISNPVEKVLATGETVYLSNHTTLIAKDGKTAWLCQQCVVEKDRQDNQAA